MSDVVVELDACLAGFRSILALVRQAADRAERQPDGPFVESLSLPDLGSKTRDRRVAIRRFFDDLQQALFEQFFVGMVATFERWAFIHIDNAIGEARKVVGAEYDSKIVFAVAAQRLVKEAKDIDLAHVEDFVGCYPGNLAANLQELRHHRNWLAHGKRIGRQSTFNRIEDVHAALCEVVRAIEG